MPIPVVSFQQEQIDPISPFLRGAAAGQNLFAQGVKNAFLPQMSQAELQKMQLANALAEIQNKYAEPQAQASLALDQARLPYLQAQTQGLNITNKYLPQDLASQIALRQEEAKIKKFQAANPLLTMQGPAGQVGALLYLQQHPELNGTQQAPAQAQMPYSQNGMSVSPQLAQTIGQQLSGMQQPQQAQQPQDLAGMLKQSIIDQMRQKSALTNYLNTRTQAYGWSNLPAQAKNYALAQAKALGYQPEEANRLFNQGATLAQMAQSKGYDPNNLPLPEYLPTPTTLTRFQQSKVALSALNTLDPIVTEAVAPYARRFKGYSLDQVAGAISGEDPDKQAKYLAAAALQPEIAALRIKAAQGQVGITAINEMIASAQNRISTLGVALSPEVYTKMNSYITQWLNKANDSEQRALDVYEKKYRDQPREQETSDIDYKSLSDEEIMYLTGGANG